MLVMFGLLSVIGFFVLSVPLSSVPMYRTSMRDFCSTEIRIKVKPCFFSF